MSDISLFSLLKLRFGHPRICPNPNLNFEIINFAQWAHWGGAQHQIKKEMIFRKKNTHYSICEKKGKIVRSEFDPKIDSKSYVSNIFLQKC